MIVPDASELEAVMRYHERTKHHLYRFAAGPGELDWANQPDPFRRYAGAAPGRGGTILAQAAWLPVLRALGMRPWFGKTIYAASAGKAFDAQGKLTDETLRKLLAEFMAGFAGFVRG